MIRLFLIIVLLLPSIGQAQLDLHQASRESLPNGMTLIILEEHSFPSVSVQMLYRVGGRDEQYGRTGIAHFLEHMAFRASENFPDTDVVSQIYAAGGEWHGYTWIDQTTYYSTVPSDQLDLLLRIEADRMQRLLIEPRWMEPEKGAVLAEMHGYENDPASVLHDAVVFTALQGHPYRNNVIGWESDIKALQHADVVDFYQSHYRPANAVLVVVGHVQAEQVRQRVQEIFGSYPAGEATALPHTIEPVQTGLRRIELLGSGETSLVEIAYQAPSANDADFAAMLVFQEWLSGGTGVNFMQEFGSSPANVNGRLSGLVDGLDSWYPPAAQTYLFTVRGSLAADQSEAELESVVEDAMQALRNGEVDGSEILAAQQRVLQELILDLGTHEEAAHLLAYFDGLLAIDTLLDLPNRVAEVGLAEVESLARRRLQPWQRTIGWYRPATAHQLAGLSENSALKQTEPEPVSDHDDARPVSAPAEGHISGPVEQLQAQPAARIQGGAGPALMEIPQAEIFTLANGLKLIVQQNPVAPSAYISLLLAGNNWQGSNHLNNDSPLWGMSSLSESVLPQNIAASMARIRGDLEQLAVNPADALPAMLDSGDPATRLEGLYRELLDIEASKGAVSPAARLLVVSGMVDPKNVLAMANEAFGDLPYGKAFGKEPLRLQDPDGGRRDIKSTMSPGIAQAQIGYAVPAPLPDADDYLAWRALQYILAHDYEGRLGKEAISNRGLAYYIYSEYRSDGRQAWIALSTGVDPDKLTALEALYRQQLAGLDEHPPSVSEVEEAKQHMLGRMLTARQSNAELAAGLSEQWLWHGRIVPQVELQLAISKLTREQVLVVVPAFTAGAMAIVEAGKKPANVTD